jgi:hypothetical protein
MINGAPSRPTQLLTCTVSQYDYFPCVDKLVLTKFAISQVYNVAYVPTWSDPAFTEHAAKATLALNQVFVQSRNAHFPSAAHGEGGYTNYMDEESRVATKDFANRRFGSNYPRLVELKRKYDPGNVFGRWFAASHQA